MNETTLKLKKNPLDSITDPIWHKRLSQIQSELQFDLIGLTDLKRPLTIDFYKKWLDQGLFGDMDYLKNHFDAKANPQNIEPTLLSALTIGHHYYPVFDKPAVSKPARIAMYAQNNDYHFWLKEKLNQTIILLKQEFPDHVFLPFVDSGPVLERDLAYRSGLGWFGKNTCLIHHQKGSLFFIAEILTSLPINESNTLSIATHPDLCGTCTKCIDICPTQALTHDKTMKADQCISYLTIESKKTAPIELRKKIGDWFFGCDLCQTVCPWNQKVFKLNQATANLKSSDQLLNLNDQEKMDLNVFLKDILNSSNKSLQKKMTGSALFRAAGFGLKRNAMIVIANRKIKDLEDDVKLYLKDDKLAELAQWTLSELNLPL